MGNKKKKARYLKHIAILFFIIFLIGFGIRSAWNQVEGTSSIKMSFLGDNVVNSNFKIEVVNTKESRARGLMFRKELSTDTGMLFIFPETKDHSFYMKNTYVSLDMIFVSEDMKIVGILENVPILNETPRTVGKPSRYTIEVIAGTTKRLGLKLGDLVKFDSPLPAAT